MTETINTVHRRFLLSYFLTFRYFSEAFSKEKFSLVFRFPYLSPFHSSSLVSRLSYRFDAARNSMRFYKLGRHAITILLESYLTLKREAPTGTFNERQSRSRKGCQHRFLPACPVPLRSPIFPSGSSRSSFFIILRETFFPPFSSSPTAQPISAPAPLILDAHRRLHKVSYPRF